MAFPYPTQAEFVARIALLTGLVLAVGAAGVIFAGSRFPAFWIASPSIFALLAWLAVGPGMSEEIFVHPTTKGLWRRVRTLGFPHDEEIYTRAEIRMVATVRIRLMEPERDGPTLCIAVDRKGRWLVLAQQVQTEAARADSRRASIAMGVPEVEYRIFEGFSPAWGRVQPPAPVTGSSSEPPRPEEGEG